MQNRLDHSLTLVNTNDVIFSSDTELLSHVICVDVSTDGDKDQYEKQVLMWKRIKHY